MPKQEQKTSFCECFESKNYSYTTRINIFGPVCIFWEIFVLSRARFSFSPKKTSSFYMKWATQLDHGGLSSLHFCSFRCWKRQRSILTLNCWIICCLLHPLLPTLFGIGDLQNFCLFFSHYLGKYCIFMWDASWWKLWKIPCCGNEES